LEFRGSGEKLSGVVVLTFHSHAESIPIVDTFSQIKAMFPVGKDVKISKEDVGSQFPDVEWEVLDPLISSLRHVFLENGIYKVKGNVVFHAGPAIEEEIVLDEEDRYYDSSGWM